MFSEPGRLSVLFSAAVNIVVGMIYDSKISLGIAACMIALLIFDLWNRQGKRIARAIGAKSRALLAKLVVEPSPG